MQICCQKCQKTKQTKGVDEEGIKSFSERTARFKNPKNEFNRI